MRKFWRGPRQSDSFTLVELLVVMAIIAILAALILAAGNGVMKKGMRSRASAEIQAMSAAAEGYKADNGVYPQGDGTLLTNNYTSYDGSTAGDEYQVNSRLLYIALSGQTNFTDSPVGGTKVYMSFKMNQIGNPSGAGGGSYVQDPWVHSYGYSTGTTTATSTNYPYNGNGFFDLWSSAGVTTAQATGANSGLTNAWISNWTQ